MELKKLKRIGILILILALLVFVFGNLEKANISFFPGLNVEMPLALMIFLSSLIGFVIGVFVALNLGREKKASTVPQPPNPSQAPPPAPDPQANAAPPPPEAGNPPA